MRYAVLPAPCPGSFIVHRRALHWKVFKTRQKPPSQANGADTRNRTKWKDLKKCHHNLLKRFTPVWSESENTKQHSSSSDDSKHKKHLFHFKLDWLVSICEVCWKVLKISVYLSTALTSIEDAIVLCDGSTVWCKLQVAFLLFKTFHVNDPNYCLTEESLVFNFKQQIVWNCT